MLEGSLDLKSKFEKAGGSKKVTWTVLPPAVPRCPQPAAYCYPHMHATHGERLVCARTAQTQSDTHLLYHVSFSHLAPIATHSTEVVGMCTKYTEYPQYPG